MPLLKQKIAPPFDPAVFPMNVLLVRFSVLCRTARANSADYGGALLAYTKNTLTLSENTFQNNSAYYGGALLAYTNNTLTLSENTFHKCVL